MTEEEGERIIYRNLTFAAWMVGICLILEITLVIIKIYHV